MKVFISQPMKDKTNEEIERERNGAIDELRRYFDDVEIIDSFFKNAPHDAKPLWFLGEAIKLLGEADAVCMCSGWENARGCRIEKYCAEDYGKRVLIYENGKLKEE